MPFKSEDQRRYLWANEPEIARDWTDTYGSRIQNNTGGISRLGFANGPNYKVDPNTVNQALLEDATSDYQGEEEEENPLQKFMRYMQGNAGNLSQADVTANKNFLGNMQFSQNNPYAMTSGPFKGMNAPGSSAFGSKNPQEMAQKWMKRYAKTAPTKKVNMMSEIALGSGNNTGMQQGGYEHPGSKASIESAGDPMAQGGRIGFDEGSKEYQDFENWYNARKKFYDQQSIEELKKDYYRDKEGQKHENRQYYDAAATGGIMRLGYANGPAGGASAGGDYGGNVNPQQEYAGRTFQDTYGGDGAVSGYIKEELGKVPEAAGSNWLGTKIGGQLGIGGMLPQYMLGNMLFNKIKGNQSNLQDQTYDTNDIEGQQAVVTKGNLKQLKALGIFTPGKKSAYTLGDVTGSNPIVPGMEKITKEEWGDILQGTYTI